MSRSDALKKAQKSYIEKFARVEIRMPPDMRDELRGHAAARGESVNGYIARVVREAMERDKENEARGYLYVLPSSISGAMGDGGSGCHEER